MIFGYRPELGFAATALATFAVALVLHTALLLRYKRARYFILLVIGCVLEIIGYVFRVRAYTSPYAVINFVIQYTFLVVAPVLFSAAIYAALSSLIQGRWVVWVFVVLDVVTTIIQIAGAAGIGVSESNSGDPSKFNDILIAGLAIQTLSFILFLVVLVTFIRLDRDVVESRGWRRRFSPGESQATRLQIYLLLAAALLVFARTVFRLGEAADGVYGPASSNEILFAMLDYLPVILAVFLLAIGYPGRYSLREAVSEK